MTIDDKIKDEKLQYDINREVKKTSAFVPGKIDKYEYITREEILPSDQSRIIEQAKFTYSLSVKHLKHICVEHGKNKNILLQIKTKH